MNPENPPSPRDELEGRLTALLMGELPPEEATALEARLAAEPELAALHGRLRKAMELLREATALPEQSAPTTPMQLSSERRERLLAHFKTSAPAPAPSTAPVRFAPLVKKPKRDWSWAVSLGLAAGLVAMLGAGVLEPIFGLRQKKAAFDGRTFSFHASDDVSNQTLAKLPESIGAVSGVFTDPQFQVVMRPQLAQRGAGGTFDPQSSSSIKSGLAYTPSGKEFAAHTAAPPQAHSVQMRTRDVGTLAALETPKIAAASSNVETLGTLSTDSPPAAPQPLYLGQGTTLARKDVAAPSDGEATAAMNLFGQTRLTTSTLTPPPVELLITDLGDDDKRAFATAKNGAGTWEMKGANTFTGGTTVNAGTLSLGGTSGATFSGNIGTGSGTVTLNPTAGVPNQSNAYAGTTTTTGGTLSMNGAAAPLAGTESLAVTGNTRSKDKLIRRDIPAPAEIFLPSAPGVGAAAAGAGGIIKDGTGTLTLGSATATLPAGTGGVTTFGGVITGTTGTGEIITKSGAGTLVLGKDTLADTTKAPRVTAGKATLSPVPDSEQNVFLGGGTVGRPIAAATPAPEQPAPPANQHYAFTRRETRPAPKGTPSIESRAAAQAPIPRAVPVEKARMQVLNKTEAPAKQEAKPESLHSPVDVLSFDTGTGKSKEVRFKEQQAQAAFPITPTTPPNVVAGEPVRLQEERELAGAGAGAAGNKKKLPLAGDVPVVGHLFKREPADAGGLGEPQLAEAAKAKPKENRLYYSVDEVLKPSAAGAPTAGNRSGDLAISPNAIDALIFPGQGASSPAPAPGRPSKDAEFKKEVQGAAASAVVPSANATGESDFWRGAREVSAASADATAKMKDLGGTQLLQNEFQRYPKPQQQAAQVKQWSEEAQGLYDSGRLDLAKKRAEQILSVDPTNQAARDFEKKIDQSLSDYGVAVHNETRANAIPQSDMAWARPIRRFNAPTDIVVENARPEASTEPMRRKLERIVIPKLEFREATVGEAIAFLKKKSVELDDFSPVGEKGANIVLKLENPPGAGGAKPAAQPSVPGIPGLAAPTEAAAATPPADGTNPADARITVSLTDIPLSEAIKYVTGLANMKYKVEPYAISVVPITENTEEFVTKEWKVPPDLIPRAPGIAGAVAGGRAAADATLGGTGIADRESAKNWLIANGVTFNGSASAIYVARSNRVIVRNTQDQLDLVDTIVTETTKAEETAKAAQSSAAVPQPEIRTSENPFSTFSLNVSDVSFKLAGASLEKGQMPDPANVRSEEFVNAFDYRDPEPAPGAPLAFVTERARYPFAQNRDLVRFAVKTAAAGRQAGRPLNIVLLLDKSGSMERADRVNIVREALRVLTAQLQPQDKLSIVTFARTPRLWADGVAGDKAGETIARVNEITPEGGTNLEAALDLGYATALRHFTVGSVSRVVLFTDGAANLGDVNPDALEKKVEAHRKQGVALDCFGIGWEGYNDDLLEQFTHHGDGRYGFINTPEEAADNFAAQLAGALQVAAADVKVQVEFNPRRVTAYRQIGYAKHQLTKEQFRDNTVDAAEIGAAESGNALYVVEVDPRGEGDLATVRVRFKVPGTSDYREHEWPVPFAGNALPLEQASSTLRLAGTAGAFSEMLAGYAYAAEVTSDRLLGVLNGVPAIYDNDPRPKKLEWMIRQARSLSGR